LPRVMKNSCENFEMQHVNISHMLHGAGIWIQTFTNIYPINHPNAGKYILYMKHLGIYIYMYIYILYRYVCVTCTHVHNQSKTYTIIYSIFYNS
jgi:hypothetical protein